MASAAMIHFGLDPGKFVRFLSGEYTGQYQDVRRTLDAVKDHVNTDDYNHIFIANPKLVRKTMNKEDRYSHLVPMDPILCKFSPYLCHTTQSIVIKEGKNNHIVWDGLAVLKPTNIVMNQITPVD
jgi:hypothetical protein